jgi:DNA-binding SARP family transcriptional activator/WD40 repeat protein
VGARLQFSILGPLEVRRNGAILAVGGPRQRALLALFLCNSNRVLSRDRLIEELLTDEPGRSPERVVRVQVSRLRKALTNGDDDPRLLARPPGYVLRVEAGELDLHAFEALAGDGRAALQHEDAARAAALLREAETLWRGRPLADLEFEPFARFEVQRLEELRLLALEDRIEAELALGRHAALCPELATLTSEYPLRERLRGQLMLALYRSGRQADALAVYRQTGEMLREELGLDPSRMLQELEHSILVQDASLDGGALLAVASGPDAPHVCPFKGLEFFDRDDAEYFFGRQRVTAELLARFTESSLVGILGPSGIGKSSLLRAGVLAAMSGGELPGSASWPQVLLRPGERPRGQLERALGGEPIAAVLDRLGPGQRLVIAVDQLEELFTTCGSESERTAFLEQLEAAAQDGRRRALVLVALRGDFYMRFAAYPGFAELLSSSHMLVGPMDRDELAEAIEQPTARAGLEIERPLVDALVSDTAAQTGGLPLLSAMLLELWQARDGCVLRYEAYRASGGTQAAVARLAEAAYTRFRIPERRVVRSVMLRLATEQDGTLTRRRAPVAELEQIDGANAVVAALIDDRLLTLSDGKIELSHEALLREWPRYRAWLEEDRAGRRVHAHLTAAAGEWDARGRDPGELYRGARLAGALEWAVNHEDRLNCVEREFLDRARLESERQQRRQRTQNRRLRSLLLAVGALLVVAVGAAMIARGKQRSASTAARVALGRQLGAEAVTEPQLDLAMLMAREAVALDRSPQTEATLLTTLLRSPAVIGTIDLPTNTTAALAFSPDGRMLVAGDGLGELRFFNPRTHATVAPAIGELADEQPPVYSADGSLLAYRSNYCQCGFIPVLDARGLQSYAELGIPPGMPPAQREIPGGSIAIAPDKRTVYYAYWSADSAATLAAAYLQRWTLPGATALPVLRVGWHALLAIRLVDGGSRLMIASTRDVKTFEAGSLRLLRTATFAPAPAAPTAGAISPDGRTVAIGYRDGAVSFVNTATGATRTTTAGHEAPVARVLYAADGDTAVSVGNDDTVIVWNPQTARPDEVVAGPPGQVAGAAISPDGRTLYTSSQNGLLLEWDLAGARSFGDRAGLGSATARCCGVLAPPAPPLAFAPNGSRFAVRLGPATVGLFSTSTLRRLATFTIEPSHGPITALAWSPAGHELAVAGYSGLVQLWSTDGAPRLVRPLVGLRSMFGQPEAVQSVAFSSDGSLVAGGDNDITGSIDGGAATDDHASLAIWQAATGKLLAAPPGLNTGQVDQQVGDDLLAFSPDRKLIAMSLFDGSILIFDAASGQVRQAFASPSGTTSMAFAPDGTLATGTPAGTVQFWNPMSGREIGSPLVVASTAVTSIAFDASGARLATAGLGEGTVKLWFASTLQQQGAALSTDPGTTAAVAFEPGADRLLAVDDTGHAVSWPMSLQAWEHQACTVAGRNLTRQEWLSLGIGRPYTTVCGP